MARGDLTIFQQWQDDDGQAVHDYAADVFKLLLIDNTTPPTAADATPRLADYVANEVATTGGYPANGIIVTSTTWVIAAAVATFDGASISLLQDAGGFTDAWWAVLYNDTAANDEAVCFIDLGGPVSEQASPININFNLSGIFTSTIV